MSFVVHVWGCRRFRLQVRYAASPFSGAVGGLMVGTRGFVDRVRRMIRDKPEDGELPQLKRLRSQPSLATIVAVVAAHFGAEPGRWAAGRRSDDAARAVAAHSARRRFGHPAVETARALVYRDHSGVGRAVRRVEQGTPELQKTVQTLERRLANP